MAADKVAIANMALRKIGARNITSFTQSGVNEADIVNDVYDDILEEVLSEHPWSFAQKRTALSYVVPADVSRTIDDNVYTPVTITGATQAAPVVITAVAHGLVDGDWVYISSVGGMTELNGNFYIVDDATTDTFSLNDTDGDDVDGSAYSAFTTGGQIQKAFDLPMTDDGVAVVYIRPTDMIKPIMKSNTDAIVKVENGRIVSDVQNLKLIYTFKNEDTTTYFPKFTQALATRLAAEICFAITNSVTKSKQLIELYENDVLPSAIMVDSAQGSPIEIRQDEWLNEMLEASSQFKTTGDTWHPF